MYKYWYKLGDKLKHNKYGVGTIIRLNNLDGVWAVKLDKTGEIKIYGLEEIKNTEVVS